LFVGALPMASAQAGVCPTSPTCATTLKMEITPPTQAIKPLGPVISLPIKVSYTYNPQASVALASTPIALKVTNAPSWVVTTLSPSTVYIPVSQVNDVQGTSGGKDQDNAFLLVSTTADAPAFQQGTIEVQADAPQNGQLQTATTKTQIAVQADFFSIIEATTPSSIQKAKPQAQVSYPVTVTNFGNAQTKVSFFTDNVPDKWQVTPPPPVTLLSKQQGGNQNSKTVNVVVQTPFSNGYLNVVGAITVRITSAYALDPKVVGDSTIVSTLTTTKGFYVPGFEPLFGLMAIGGLAIALRRKGGR
ncbi:MAG: hypothetical protein LC624_04325, partial [Halobacteriales archaeon]|nr:hypothetical protein [Halobacteriales archaeon]